MNYIVEYPDIFSKEFCKKAIDIRNRHKPDSYSDLVFWKKKNYTSEIEDLAEEMHAGIEPCIVSFFKQFGDLMKSRYTYLAGLGLIRQPIGLNDLLHYDIETVFNEGEVKMRPFICLVYLNDDFEGGQLVFPKQKKIVSPSLGKVVIFPATYLFPHKVLGIAKAERFFIRTQYMFKNYMLDKDLDEWDATKDVLPRSS